MDMGLNCPRDFYFHIDGLAMQAKEDGLDFAIRDTTALGATANLTDGTIGGFSGDNQDWDYNPGARFGLGFYLSHDAWNLDFNWTWLNITNYNHFNASNNGGSVLPLWLTGDATPAAVTGGTRSSAKWQSSYNTFDIRLAKPYHVSRYFILNPHFGLRGGWIDQAFSVDYGGAQLNSTTRTIFRSSNDFWGVGARCGIDTDWVLGKGWCLFGNIAASMLFGKFEVDESMTYPNATSGGFNVDYNFYQNVPNMEMMLGIGWGRHFSKHRYHTSLKLAYEFHEWWDQLNLRKFYSGSTSSTGGFVNDTISRGNLTLNGFSLRWQIDI
jgi:hypothetical protein